MYTIQIRAWIQCVEMYDFLKLFYEFWREKILNPENLEVRSPNDLFDEKIFFHKISCCCTFKHARIIFLRHVELFQSLLTHSFLVVFLARYGTLRGLWPVYNLLLLLTHVYEPFS